MNIIEKLEPTFIFGSVILGLLCSNISIIKQISPSLITIFLSLMLFALFLDIPIRDIRNSFHNIKFTSTSIIINFIWTPVFGFFIGNLFLNANVDLLLGFFMLILTPCTDWYLVFTRISKGDVALSLSILPINLVLQLILLPVYLLVFSTAHMIEISDLAISLITYIVIPFVLASIVKYLLNDSRYKNKVTGFFSDYQLIFLCIAIFGLFNTQAHSLLSNIDSIWILFIPIILFFVINSVLGYIVSKRLNFSYKEYASLTFTTLARNSPLALAIAISSFPHNELIAISLVIGPLIELPVLYIISQILLKLEENY